jgi:excisionase family DNA binding protein
MPARFISTFAAARLLFRSEKIESKHLRAVQRLCVRNELEWFKVGRKYRIVRQSVLEYIERWHGRRPGDTD